MARRQRKEKLQNAASRTTSFCNFKRRTRSGKFRLIILKKIYLIFITLQRDELAENILQLGGLVYEEEFLNESVTHLICMAPNRSQKYLSALASGLYILHYSYIEETIKAGFFVNEEPFEFGNPRCSKETNVPVKDMDLVHAAYRWRMKITNEEKFKNGAFTGFKVMILCHNEKIRQFAAVVRSGGGEFVSVQPPFSRRAVTGYGITHCFIEGKVKLNPSDADIKVHV